jgi:hypothetical protein
MNGVVDFYQSNSTKSLLQTLDEVSTHLKDSGIKLNEYCARKYSIEKMTKQYSELYNIVIK